MRRFASALLAMVGLDFSIDLTDERFHRITERLHLGGRPEPDDVSELQSRGITHVVSCLPDDARSDMRFLDGPFDATFIALHDGVYEDLAPAIPVFFDALERAEGEGGALFVHCAVGVSRSASLVIAAVMQRDGLRFFEAYDQVRARRPAVRPNVGFASQLQRREHAQLGPRPSGPSSLALYLDAVCKAPVDIEVLEQALQRNDYVAMAALRDVFGDDIPRVIRGVRR